MVSQQMQQLGIAKLRRVLMPGGVPLQVVGAREMRAIANADLMEVWGYIYGCGKSTPRAIRDFLDVIDDPVDVDDDMNLLPLGPDRYVQAVDGPPDIDPLGESRNAPLDISTGMANALARFDILH